MEDLCFRLLFAKSEAEVREIVEKDPIFSTQDNWAYINNQDNNFGIIDSQGRNPERALIEKITNSIDAVLLKECKSRNIDPGSNQAPTSINDALTTFFDIEQGNLSTISEEKRDKLSSLIYVIAENLKDKKANFYFIDKGEGQTPLNFKNTFLKFGGNKASTRFVHGRFGTGSFGVLPNCGDNKYQLIISKNFKEISNENSFWGWTLIRKNKPKDIYSKHAWYEYFVFEKNIPTFDYPDLSSKIKESIRYEKLDLTDFKYGTIIKLYDYDLLNSHDIDRGLNRVFNRYLFSPALPFRILDAQTESNVGPGKEVIGNLNRLKKNKTELETGDKLIIQNVIIPKLGQVDIDIYISKRRPEKKHSFIESEKISTNAETVFFIRNGQSHGELPRSFIKDEVGLDFIAKDMAIFIDCTNTLPGEFDEIFSPTRDNLRENRHRLVVENSLRSELKNHIGLQEINIKRRSEIITENIQKSKDIETFVNDLYNLDPAFRKLLSGNIKISDPFYRGNSNQEEYKGKYIPSFLRIKDNEIKNIGYKNIPINSYVRVVFETDAQNDYLYRETDKGELSFEFNGKVSSYIINNGKLYLKVYPPNPILAGLKDNFKIILARPHEIPLIQEFLVKYCPAKKPSTNPSKPPSPPNTKKLSFPKFSPVPMNKWLEVNENGNDLCELIVEKDEQEKIYVLKEVIINSDFPYFKQYLQSQNLSPEKMKEMKEQFEQAIYISGICVHKDFSYSNFPRETVRIIMTQLGKSLPFVLFTMQKKWLKELVSQE